MKKSLIIIIALFIALPVFASVPPSKFRAYYPKTSKTYYCDSVYWGTLGTYCYSFVRGVLTSHGVGMLQEWSGLYDSKGVKIYEGDRVSTPTVLGKVVPDGIVEFGETSTFYGWYIAGDDGKFYTLQLMPFLRKSEWSTVL